MPKNVAVQQTKSWKSGRGCSWIIGKNLLSTSTEETKPHPHNSGRHPKASSCSLFLAINSTSLPQWPNSGYLCHWITGRTLKKYWKKNWKKIQCCNSGKAATASFRFEILWCLDAGSQNIQNTGMECGYRKWKVKKWWDVGGRSEKQKCSWYGTGCRLNGTASWGRQGAVSAGAALNAPECRPTTWPWEYAWFLDHWETCWKCTADLLLLISFYGQYRAGVF